MRPPFFMEILFAGCSNTWGDELKDRLNSRYSKIMCDALGANETNIAECGRSNDWISRRVLEETKKKHYDLVVVQLTIPNRIEYFEGNEFFKFHLQGAKDKNRLHQSKMKWYYSFINNDKHAIENMYKNLCLLSNAVNTEMVVLYADCSPKSKVDHTSSYWYQQCDTNIHWMWRDIFKHEFRKGPRGKSETHPLEDQHKMIADYLLNKDK